MSPALVGADILSGIFDAEKFKKWLPRRYFAVYRVLLKYRICTRRTGHPYSRKKKRFSKRRFFRMSGFGQESKR